MILQGNQRGGARELAMHLLKDENDHVDVHELRGFVANDLLSAFCEAYAISRGTKAKQFLFSLSLNPPPSEKVPTASFEKVIASVEEKLNLNGQPRAIVFHEKNGRRHCHAVWSRTDVKTMKAIPLPYTKRKLLEISRDIYLEHGWKMPKGMVESEATNPLNFSLAQWQQAKRLGKDPRAIKQELKDCWGLSDNLDRFQAELKSRGYRLAKGRRNSFVALDHRCEIYSVAKWTGLKAKAIREKLGQTEHLPSVSDVRVKIAKDMKQHLSDLSMNQNQTIQLRLKNLEMEKQFLLEKQRGIRDSLGSQQKLRWDQETIIRQERYQKGLRGFWDRLTGRHKRVRIQNENELKRCKARDQAEKDQLIFQQLEKRQKLQRKIDRLGTANSNRSKKLSDDIKQYQEIIDHKRELFELRKAVKEQNISQRQTLNMK